MVFILLIAGCKDDPGVVGTTRVLLDYSGDFWDAPFPSDERDGIDGFPNPEGLAFVDDVLAIAGQLYGWGASSAVYLPLSAPIDADQLPAGPHLPGDDALVWLEDAETGERPVIEIGWTELGGLYGTPNLLAILPLQGKPLRPATTYRAVVSPDLLDAEGLPLAEGASVSFTTQDATAQLQTLSEAAAEHLPEPLGELSLVERFDDYCVYASTVMMPDYQAGEPPFTTQGGGIAWGDDGQPVLQRYEEANLFVTVPRTEQPPGGWPVAVFVRTGGGGDRPLVDRGQQGADGVALDPGEGPARYFAAAGLAGLQVDGPHGGLRNITNADEQFLMFNMLNPAAMLDNVRQSAIELTLLPAMIEDLSLQTCDGGTATFTTEHLALMGHSMGATIAPLTLGMDVGYETAILSGAGGSWTENVIYKQKPLDVLPLAEVMVGTPLYRTEPLLNVLQWAGESADPPLYAERVTADVLMLQGIVDHYIMPPIANVTALSLDLDLAGEPLDSQTAEVADLPHLADLLQFSDGEQVDLPASGSLVIQHPEDGLQDGHEVVFQTDAPKAEYSAFLKSSLVGTPEVP